MKKHLHILAMVLCCCLVCGICVGCVAAGPMDGDEPTTEPAGTTQSTAPEATTQFTEPTEATEPTEPTQSTNPFDPNDMTYTVRVVDEEGNPMPGIGVEIFYPGQMEQRVTDNNGVAKWEHMQWHEDAMAYIRNSGDKLEGYIYHKVTFELDGVFEQTIVVKKQVMRTYRIRFVDEDGLPMENLCVSLNYEKAYTDVDGYAQWEMLEKYGYSVRLEDVPEWYIMKYDIPYDTWELTIVVIKMHDYTVRVVDKQGNPIPNVSCTLVGERDDRLRTDENGCVTWKKFRGNYLLGCSINVGHDVVGARQYFPEGQTEMTIVLDLTSSVYPMQVVDGDGQPLKGSYIQIKTGNEAIAWDVTDENGMIYWELASAPVYVEYCTEYDLFGGDFVRLEAVRYAWPEGETAMTLVWENKLVTYQIRLVDANGSPVMDVYVRIHPEGGMDSDYRVGTADDHAGMIVFRDLERNYTVRIYYGNEMILYGTFEFAADEMEVTIVVEIPEE